MKALNKLWQFMKKDIIIQFSYKFYFIGQMMSALFTLVILYYVSQIITPDSAFRMTGKDYFEFALLGVSMFGFLTVGLNEFSRVIRRDQTSGILEYMFSTKSSTLEIIIGSNMVGFIKAATGFCAYLAASILIFNFRFDTDRILAVIIVLILTIIAISSLGIIAAAFVLFFKQKFTRWIASFTGVFSGAFFPVEVLPEWIQVLSLLSPLTYSLNAIRGLLLKSLTVREIMPNVIALCIFIIIFLPLSLFIFNYFLKMARKNGNLGEY